MDYHLTLHQFNDCLIIGATWPIIDAFWRVDYGSAHRRQGQQQRPRGARLAGQRDRGLEHLVHHLCLLLHLLFVLHGRASANGRATPRKASRRPGARARRVELCGGGVALWLRHCVANEPEQSPAAAGRQRRRRSRAAAAIGRLLEHVEQRHREGAVDASDGAQTAPPLLVMAAAATATTASSMPTCSEVVVPMVGSDASLPIAKGTTNVRRRRQRKDPARANGRESRV